MGLDPVHGIGPKLRQHLGGSTGHQPGRQLMTAADFKTPEEFEIYRAGADRLPLGILPGSWEGHLLTAMAAMVAAGIERHEARIAPAPAPAVEPRPVPHPDLAELRAFRQWCADKVNGGVIASTSEHLRGHVDVWIKERVDAALRKADAAALEERARIVKALRDRSKPTEKDYPVERHLAELFERGLL